MFSWIRMLRKPRRLTPTVKPGLEKLEDRTLLSTSGVASQTVIAAMVRQEVQLFATVQSEALSIGREIAQKIAQALVRLDQILGIAPNLQNVSLNSLVSTAAIGSGSVNGTITITHIASNQQPSNSTQPAVSSTTIKPMDSPGGPDIGGNGGYLWDPTHGTNASNALNWDYNGLPQNDPATAKRPGDTPEPVTFDPKATTAPGLHGAGASDIIWDYIPARVLTINLGGQSAYIGTQTIKSNIAVDASVNAANTTVSLSSDFHLNFTDGTSKFQIDGNSTITNMHLGGSALGQFLINSGTTLIATDPGAGNPAYVELEGVSFVVGSNAELIDFGYNPLKFWASNVNIKVQGQMEVYYGPNATNTQIDINGNTKDYIDVNKGTLEYIGKQGVTDTFSAPVMVENNGDLLVTGSATENGGRLIVQGNLNGTAPGVSNNASVYMKDTGTYLSLSGGITLECDNDYYQASGYLRTTDTSSCALQDGPTNQLGTATIAGGYLQIAVTGGVAYASFFIDCTQLNFGGTYETRIAGNAQAVNSTLSIGRGNGTINLQGSSALNVVVTNQPQAGQKLSWSIIYAGNYLNKQFNTETSTPNTPGLKYGPAQGAVYNVTYGM